MIVTLDNSLAPKPVVRAFAHGADDGSIWQKSLQNFRQLYFRTSAIQTEEKVSYFPSSTALFDAISTAYNCHLDLVLTPDDLNLNANLNLSRFVAQNHEAMRSMFVQHLGEKELHVLDSGTTDLDWDAFFGRMQALIGSSVSPGLADVLQNDFSTTSAVDCHVGAVVTMSTFAKYFTYRRRIPNCGIRSVHFAGERADWVRLQAKFGSMGVFFDRAGQDRLRSYYAGLVRIIDNFVDSFDGRVDRDWWNRVMDGQKGRLGSGSTIYYSGWIRELFLPTFDCPRATFDMFLTKTPEVSVHVESFASGYQYQVKVMAGWNGVSVDEQNRVKPVKAVGVYQNLATIKRI